MSSKRMKDYSYGLRCLVSGSNRAFYTFDLLVALAYVDKGTDTTLLKILHIIIIRFHLMQPFALNNIIN